MNRFTKFTGVLAAGVLLLALVLFASEAAEGVRAGLSIAAETALPSLFPFFVAGSLMVRTGLAAILGRLLTRPFHTLYGLPGAGAAAVVLGLLGGYPIGVQVTAQLYQAGQLTHEEAERLLGFVNCSGPAFIVGMCGAALCGSVKTGLILYGIHVAAALMTGLVLTRSPASPPRPARPAACEPFPTAFVGSVADGIDTAIKVTAFIVFFAVLLALARALELLPLLAAALTPLLLLAGLPAGAGEACAAGLIELINGLTLLPALGLSAHELLPLISALVSFGGLSIHCQTLSILSGTGLSARRYFLGKLLHAILSYALASIWCAAAPHSAPVFAPVEVSIPTFSVFPLLAAFLVVLLTKRCGKLGKKKV